MPNHHHATPDEWAQQADWAADRRSSVSSCIVELRARIEALEAAQHVPAKPEHQDKLDRLIEQDRSNAKQLTLVERVTELYPAAAAIVKAFDDRYELLSGFDDNWQELCIAAALRAVAEQVAPSDADEPRNCLPMAIECQRIRSELLVIAAELEAS